MPLQATSGAASYDGFGGGVAVEPVYIESIFSTYLYAGTNANITINNGIDLAGKGGLVWQKQRTSALPHRLFTTAMALGAELATNSTGQLSNSGNLTAYSSTGFTLFNALSDVGENYVTWTFRKQPKFFDVVTYTGTGSNTTIAHSLGSVPGSIIVKRTNAVADWTVYHRSLANTEYLVLNSTAAKATGATWWNSTTPTSTVFSVGTDASVNASGGTYVAYLFAHDAGGFGLTGTDNVISCGSYTGSSSDVSINLGYEAQWILVKNTSRAGTNWQMLDVMRGMPLAGTALSLAPNLADAESALTAPVIVPTATGMTITGGLGFSINYNGDSYIYIAIRRGPMKVPTLGTSVFSPIAYTGNSTTNTTVQNLTTSFAGDAVIIPQRTGGNNPLFFDKLRGGTKAIYTSLTLAEETITAGESVGFNNTQTVLTGQYTAQGNYNYSGDTFVSYNFRRAPGFFDEVCYTPSAYTDLIYHNLGVVPELIIAKNRGATATQWYIHHSALGASQEVYFTTDPVQNGGLWTRTSTYWNNSSALYPLGQAHVAYLFATCAGVSKVGSYTGTATTKQIDCGFTGGARFVLIKRTDSTGDWYVWDSARGIVAGNDPYLLLNSTAAEVTSTDYVDTYSAGFEISSTAPAAINASGGSFIFLAIS